MLVILTGAKIYIVKIGKWIVFPEPQYINLNPIGISMESSIANLFQFCSTFAMFLFVKRMPYTR